MRDINVSSLKFGRTGHEVSLTGHRTLFRIYRDVDRDGKLDLVLFVNLRSTGLKVGHQIGLTHRSDQTWHRPQRNELGEGLARPQALRRQVRAAKERGDSGSEEKEVSSTTRAKRF